MRRISTVNCIFLLLVAFNLLISFSTIWSFQQIGPRIKEIQQRNAYSIYACEEMLQILARGKVEKFSEALEKAENNITEEGERGAINRIRALLPELEAGNKEAVNEVVDRIAAISRYNRKAIENSIDKAQRARQEGVWDIVFLTLIFFLFALYFGRKFHRELLLPLEELSSTMEAFLAGDTLRRCSLPFAEGKMQKLFRDVNELMDRLCRFR